jgi:hypothetical protein
MKTPTADPVPLHERSRTLWRGLSRPGAGALPYAGGAEELLEVGEQGG